MNLTDTGQSRVNGYLFVLERSLKTALPRDAATDATREIESHLRDRIAACDGAPNERDALERILLELGPPLRVAQAYSAERTIDEALATWRVVPMFRALFHLAVTSVAGFAAALGVFVGYLVSFALLMMATMKPVFPDNVGLWVDSSGIPHNFGIRFPAPLDEHIVGGYWIIPISALCGMGLLVLTYRGARRFLTWWRNRRVS